MNKLIFQTRSDIEAAVGGPQAQSGWHTVTQSMVDDFARLTRDPQWIHIDPERARRESPFGTTIAHGFLLLSLLTPLIAECVELPPVQMGINYGFDRMRFITPVTTGAAIRGSFTLADVKETAGGLALAWTAELGIRDAPKPAIAAIWLIRLMF